MIFQGLNMLAAVGQGALVLPRLVILRYKGQQGALEDDVQDGKSEKETIALVGKGVTFDSGGLNIKPTNFIEEMYMDMGCVHTIARLRLLSVNFVV